MGDEGFLEQVVDKWRASGIGTGGDMSQQLSMMADAMSIPNGHDDMDALETSPSPDQVQPVRAALLPSNQSSGSTQTPQSRPSAPALRKDMASQAAGIANGARPSAQQERRPSMITPVEADAENGSNSLRSLRERLTRPLGR